jgi:uncharacterized protein with PIN domain
MPLYTTCPQCEERNMLTLVSSEKIQTPHFIDYRISYRCLKCGKEWTVG